MAFLEVCPRTDHGRSEKTHYGDLIREDLGVRGYCRFISEDPTHGPGDQAG